MRVTCSTHKLRETYCGASCGPTDKPASGPLSPQPPTPSFTGHLGRMPGPGAGSELDEVPTFNGREIPAWQHSQWGRLWRENHARTRGTVAATDTPAKLHHPELLLSRGGQHGPEPGWRGAERKGRALLQV